MAGDASDTEDALAVAEPRPVPEQEDSASHDTEDQADDDEENKHESSEDEEEDEEDDDEDDDSDDDEPKLKYARLTSHLLPVYRNGDATSTFMVAGDKMVGLYLLAHNTLN
jgi:hypothetical protein